MSHSSRRPYAGISDSRYTTCGEYQEFSRHPLRHREIEPRRPVTVTREYTAHGTRRSSFGHHHTDSAQPPRDNSRMPEAGAEYTYSCRPKPEFRRPGAQRDDRHGKSDRRYSSDEDTIPEKRDYRGPKASADEGRGYNFYAPAKHSQQEEPKPAYESRYSGIPREKSSNKQRRSHHQSQEKPNKSRSNDRRQEDSRSNRNNYEGSEQRSYRDEPKPSQSTEPESTSRDGQSRRSTNYNRSKFATNGKPSQGKPEGGSNRSQGKPHSSRGESYGEEIPGSHRNDSSHEIPGSHSSATGNLPDFYAILKIDRLATDEQIRIAAKRRRVEVHPDKLKQPGMSNSESDEINAVASKVGQAADVLLNPAQKLEYDRKLYAAKG